jgi:hypothetical protein
MHGELVGVGSLWLYIGILQVVLVGKRVQPFNLYQAREGEQRCTPAHLTLWFVLWFGDSEGALCIRWPSQGLCLE